MTTSPINSQKVHETPSAKQGIMLSMLDDEVVVDGVVSFGTSSKVTPELCDTWADPAGTAKVAKCPRGVSQLGVVGRLCFVV